MHVDREACPHGLAPTASTTAAMALGDALAIALSLKAEDFLTPDPVTIGGGELATRALNIMENRKITALMVTDQFGRIIGVIHLHDLWGTEMF